MKNLKLKLTIIGISLLSINAFAQDYVYQGVKNVDATIGMNNSESDSDQETVSEDCYDPANIGKTIQAKGCDGLLIVDNNSLRQMVRDDGNYADTAIFTGQVTDMSFLFCNYNGGSYFDKCTFKNPIYSISNWNTENVKNTLGMFTYSTYNQPLDNWNVSNVTDMSYMFWNSSYNQPLNSWNVSNVTKMNSIFRESVYNQPLNNWDVSNVTNMSWMFYKSSYNHPLNNWNVSNVTDMWGMFAHAVSFNQPLNEWDVSNVTDMKSMFMTASSFNQPLNNWNVSNVTDMRDMFGSATQFSQDISDWCVPLIPFKPSNFDSHSGFENQNSLQPNWGCN